MNPHVVAIGVIACAALGVSLAAIAIALIALGVGR